MTLLAQVGVLLAATVIAIPLFRRFRLSSVLGYLAAGIAIGPWSLRLVTDTDGVRDIAEFGVVLLLFVIGLELQPSRLHAMRRAIFGLGLLQVVVTSIAFAVIGMAFGLSSSTAAVVGFALSLSSTPLVLQLLAEREQLNTHHGRSSFGILLFQDIAVMPMLAILPMLGTNGGVDRLSQTWPSIVKGLAVLAVLIFGGRLLLRPVLRMVANTKVREAFTAAALLVVIGTSLLVSAVGLSMALGAFVAGLLLADSEYRHELEADIEPFKGLLLGLFFISVGMTANLGLIVERPLTVVALVVGLIAIKSVLLWVLGRATGHSGEGVRGLAFALPQAGEFGFVIFALAVRLAIMDQPLADLLVIVVTASMIVSPLLMNLQYAVLEPLFKKEKPREYDRIDAAEPRVIVSGVGRFGQIVCRVLRMRRIPFTALEADAEQIETLRRYGSKVYYGDASRLELLQAARADRAELFILAISDVEASIRTVETLNKHFPNLKILARARNRQHALRLMELGVRYIVRETYFSGLELAQQTLETLGLTRADAEDSIRKFRTIDEKALRAQLEFKDDEQKLIQNAQLVAKELERLFESDTELTEDQPQVTARPVTS
jgi:glutathione-regulated potassium-efflux system ancillary protein KefC/glutathione-regulated potassium-efflux system protein KefB